MGQGSLNDSLGEVVCHVVGGVLGLSSLDNGTYGGEVSQEAICT